jgi:hypothetical protein
MGNLFPGMSANGPYYHLVITMVVFITVVFHTVLRDANGAFGSIGFYG